MLISARLEERLDNSTIPVTESGCWLWDGYCMPNGYGVVRDDERTKILAHRASYAVHNGPIPKGMNVCHSCDVPSCVNPSHLWVGTQADNLDDMTKKGRRYFKYGEQS